MKTGVVGRYDWRSSILQSLAFVVGIAILIYRRVLHQGPSSFDVGIAILVLYDAFMMWRTMFNFYVFVESGQVLFRGKHLKSTVKCQSVVRVDSEHLQVRFNPLILVYLEGQPDMINAIEVSFLSIKRKTS